MRWLITLLLLGMILLGLWWNRHTLYDEWRQFNLENEILVAERGGEYRRALRIARRGMNDLPRRAGVFYAHQARLYERQGEWRKAITALEKTVAHRPTHLAAHLELGRLYRQHQQWRPASQLYRETVKRFPKSPLLLVELGEFYLASAQAYRKQAQSKMSRWLLDWSAYYFDLADREGAPRHLTAGRLGQVAMMRHRYTEAAQYYCRDLREGTRSHHTRYMMGVALLHQGWQTEGLAQSQHALHQMAEEGDVTAARRLAEKLQTQRAYLAETDHVAPPSPSLTRQSHDQDEEPAQASDHPVTSWPQFLNTACQIPLTPPAE